MTEALTSLVPYGAGAGVLSGLVLVIRSVLSYRLRLRALARDDAAEVIRALNGESESQPAISS